MNPFLLTDFFLSVWVQDSIDAGSSKNKPKAPEMKNKSSFFVPPAPKSWTRWVEIVFILNPPCSTKCLVVPWRCHVVLQHRHRALSIVKCTAFNIHFGYVFILTFHVISCIFSLLQWRGVAGYEGAAARCAGEGQFPEQALQIDSQHGWSPLGRADGRQVSAFCDDVTCIVWDISCERYLGRFSHTNCQ